MAQSMLLPPVNTFPAASSAEPQSQRCFAPGSGELLALALPGLQNQVEEDRTEHRAPMDRSPMCHLKPRDSAQVWPTSGTPPSPRVLEAQAPRVPCPSHCGSTVGAAQTPGLTALQQTASRLQLCTAPGELQLPVSMATISYPLQSRRAGRPLPSGLACSERTDAERTDAFVWPVWNALHSQKRCSHLLSCSLLLSPRSKWT